MGIGDGLRGFMGVRFDLILQEWGQVVTILRTPANVQATMHIDRPQPDRDMAPRTHEYDVVLREGEPNGAPLRPGELLRDAGGAHYLVRVLRLEPPIAVGQLWRCNAVATIWRTAKSVDPVSKVTTTTPVQAATGIRCRISLHPGTQATQHEGRPLQTEGRWLTEETYAIATAAGVLQAGDEIEAPGWPRLKVGRPAMGDAEDASWEVPATPVLPRGVPGSEV